MPQFTNMHSLQTCKSIATEVTAEVMEYFSALPQIIEQIFELCNKYVHTLSCGKIATFNFSHMF